MKPSFLILFLLAACSGSNPLTDGRDQCMAYYIPVERTYTSPIHYNDIEERSVFRKKVSFKKVDQLLASMDVNLKEQPRPAEDIRLLFSCAGRLNTYLNRELFILRKDVKYIHYDRKLLRELMDQITAKK